MVQLLEKLRNHVDENSDFQDQSLLVSIEMSIVIE